MPLIPYMNNFSLHHALSYLAWVLFWWASQMALKTGNPGRFSWPPEGLWPAGSLVHWPRSILSLCKGMLCLPFSLAISHACSQLSGLCLWFQPWWHIIPVLKDGIFQSKKQQKTNRGNVAMSKGFSTVSPTVLQSNPAFGWRVGKKSDNEVIVLPTQAILLFLTPPWAVLATGRHRLGLPQVVSDLTVYCIGVFLSGLLHSV